MIVKLAAEETENNNCGIASSSSLERSSSVSQIVLYQQLSDVILGGVMVCLQIQTAVFANKKQNLKKIKFVAAEKCTK